MKRSITQYPEDEVRQEFPIVDRLDGWFFRRTEVSAGVFEAAGTDLWGRSVAETGTSPEALLANCVNSARELQLQLRQTFDDSV